jgi:hypothetical protein
MCIVPGTTLTRRPALRTNHAGAVPSAGTARKKGAPFCASAPLQARWHDPTRHEEATVLLRAGPNRARAGLGPGGPFGILYNCLLRSTTTVFLACTSVPSSSRIHGTNASDRSSCRDKMQHLHDHTVHNQHYTSFAGPLERRSAVCTLVGRAGHSKYISLSVIRIFLNTRQHTTPSPRPSTYYKVT